MSSAGHSPVFKSSRVLVIGNHQERLWRIKERIEPLAQSVFVAHSSQTAVELCRDFQFAAVIVDFEKMGREAIEAAEIVRSTERSHQVPVILVGNPESQTSVRYLDRLFGPVDINDPNLESIISTQIADTVRDA